MKYRTIVADPPWPYDTFYGADQGEVSSPYPVMSVAEIKALPVRELAETDNFSGTTRKRLRREGREAPGNLGCHLYLWTTQRFLWDARDVAETWGFTVLYSLVWCKAPMGLGSGHATFRGTVEYVLFCKRGNPKAKTSIDRQHFEWPRGRHSQKPDAFLDLVETVSSGPYLELFARRQRLGWDTWGNEALEHVTVGDA